LYKLEIRSDPHETPTRPPRDPHETPTRKTQTLGGQQPTVSISYDVIGGWGDGGLGH
jgi:hypothetical protein